MDIQIKNVDALIETCSTIDVKIRQNYEPKYNSWGVDFLGWESNAEDKKIIDDKIKRIHENTARLYSAMLNFNNSLLTYARNLKGLSSNRSGEPSIK